MLLHYPDPLHPMNSLHSRFALISAGYRQRSRTSMRRQTRVIKPSRQADTAELEFKARGRAAKGRQDREFSTSNACPARTGELGCRQKKRIVNFLAWVNHPHQTQKIHNKGGHTIRHS